MVTTSAPLEMAIVLVRCGQGASCVGKDLGGDKSCYPEIEFVIGSKELGGGKISYQDQRATYQYHFKGLCKTNKTWKALCP